MNPDSRAASCLIHQSATSSTSTRAVSAGCQSICKLALDRLFQDTDDQSPGFFLIDDATNIGHEMRVLSSVALRTSCLIGATPLCLQRQMMDLANNLGMPVVDLDV